MLTLCHAQILASSVRGQRYLQILCFRSNLRRSRLARLYPVLSNYWVYCWYINGWRTVVKDLLLSR